MIPFASGAPFADRADPPFENPVEGLHRDFGDDPWRLTIPGLDPETAAIDETLFALGNGYLGMRGNHEEGLPLGSHGTFVNGVHETWQIQHAESAYGFAEQGQTIVNVPDAKTIRIYVDDERLNLETSEILEVRRTLDLRAGTLSRTLLWLTPTGKRVRVESRRMVSFASRHLATLEMRVTVLDADADLTISSLLINRQDLGRVRSEQPGASKGAGRPGDPARAVDEPVDPRQAEVFEERVLDRGPVLADPERPDRSVLSFRVHHSGMAVAVGADHDFDSGARVGEDGADDDWSCRVEVAPDRIRHIFQGTAQAGRPVRLTKTAVYHSSRTATCDELIDRCVQSLHRAAVDPLEQRWIEQRDFLDAFWERSDVRVDAEPGVQQAIRWNLFQLAQAAARADGRGIAAKGLTGSGYSGHSFWDSEIYALPFLTYTSPLWARNALRFRLRMLPHARSRAAQLNEDGALFPWRTINGEEASAYYAAGTAQYHIDADITYALARYVAASGDLEFMVSGASEIPIETARMWRSLGFWRSDPDGSRRFHIHGVTGPDEYTTVVNDNLFTNVMARFNLRYGAEVARRLAGEAPAEYRALAERLGLRAEEIEAWEAAADGMAVPFSTEFGVHPQDAHFLEREVWDLAATPPEQKPLLLHFHPLVIYRFQVLKQADVVLAMLLASGDFSAAEKRANFEYYDALTTGDSTLSAVVQSVIAAEVGYRELAYRYFDHALRVDLDDLHRNAEDGVHVASAGGVWLALVQGFAGMRDAGRELSFDPRLPDHWGGMEFVLAWRGSSLAVRLDVDAIRFEILRGTRPVPLRVRGAEMLIEPGAGETRVPLDGQGPDLGAFRGLSAGILPREGESGVIPTLTTEIPVIGTDIPTRGSRDEHQ
ncbi:MULTISPECIES: glycoside hydrolase family 65 protein [unclassified Leucobacter]|uniref:glycoside hydrolase family 65 protein n=1 Tax=unclassified Leucobacter TaxID=2621730 RepID=UPI000A07CD79|nr:glycosyl hydrolase family 65 protein [Leucobacter sp. Ag1]